MFQTIGGWYCVIIKNPDVLASSLEQCLNTKIIASGKTEVLLVTDDLNGGVLCGNNVGRSIERSIIDDHDTARFEL